MDLRQLDYFLEIVERRSISAAAARLNLTQPTLTRSVQLLEEALGVQLLERLPRGVEPTPYGAVLARHARLVRVQLQDAMGEIEGMSGGRMGLVAIGAGPAWLRRFLPEAVSRAQRARPGLRVRLEGGFDDGLLRSLRQGDLDLVVAELPEPAAAPDLTLLPLAADDLGVCCREGHPLRARGKVELVELLDYPWALPLGNTRARARLDALFVAAGLSAPTPIIETDSMAFMLATLRFSDALGYTTGTLLTLGEGQGLVMLPARGITGRRTAGVISRRHAALSPAAQAIVDELVIICGTDGRN